MFDMMRFPLQEMTKCGAALRASGERAKTMEETADRVVSYLYENLGDPQERACRLVRFYKTHALGELPNDLQDFARNLLPATSPTASTKCLTLMGTRGDARQWNSRADSGGHKAIPLASASVVEQLPMVAQLVRQFGLEANELLKPRPEMMVDLEQRQYNVFHVADAVGSPYIPAQDNFVVPYGIKSVLGFGGVLPTGDLFAIIMFTRVPIKREVAEAFRTISLNVKMAIMRFGPTSVFNPS
jgi:hypothetical protein